MADLDDDLLDLAGGDSGDEGSEIESRSRSESVEPVKKDTKKAATKKTKRRARQDDSEEEGEATSEPGTPNSLESAPMDESDSDDEPARKDGDGDEDERYPVEGMYASQAEKARIMAMGELEREQIIAERVTEIERQRQNRLLRQMVENEERKQVKKKRSADTAELEDSSPRTSRQRTGKGETAMDTLRRARLEKQKRREDQERRRDAYSPRRDSLDRESEGSFGRPESRSPEAEAPREITPPDLRDFDRVRLGRNEFAQVCFTPGFEAKIAGCFIRIAVGPHPDTGIEQYRMAVIKSFSTGKAYALSGPNGSFVTDQYVKAAHGKAVREFPFIAASSGKFTEHELERYRITCSNEDVSFPTKAALLEKVDDINSLINHKWTNEEIKARLARRNELRKRFDPSERQRLARLLDEAREKGDDVKADELQEQLDQMASQRLAFRTTLGPNKNTEAASSEQDRLAERNRENRRLNAEAVRKAQLKDMAKTREIEKALQRGELVPDDPSRRVRTKAKFVHDVNEQQQELKATPNGGTATASPASGAPKSGGTKSMQPHLAKLQEQKHSEQKGLPGIHKPLMDDDVIGALDLDIDVDI